MGRPYLRLTTDALAGILRGMAVCFPDRPGPETPDSERTVFAAFARLPDPWRIFHSVAWQSMRGGRPGDGEADFVLLHPHHGLVVVEVKGGGIRVDQGRWYTLNPGGRHPISDPFEQATASKHALVGYLRGARARLPFLPAGHAVAFPDLRAVEGLGSNAPADITITRGDLDRIEEAVDRVVSHWELASRMTGEERDAITALLAPTRSVRRLLADEIAEADARLIQLTREQMRYLDFCRRERRAIISGGAGTGKTVLAVERTRRLAAEGFRVLLTCFNRPLADHLASEFRGVEGVWVYNFHGLCRWQIGRAGLGFPESPPREWWDRVSADLLVAAAEGTGFEVDAVVVDEGQDFHPAWFAALQMLLTDPDQGPMYVFADSHQAIYREEWEPPFERSHFELSVNCRNTWPISVLVARVFGDDPGEGGPHGPDAEMVPMASPQGVVPAVRRILHRWVNEEGIPPAKVAVLGQRKEVVDALRAERPGGHSLRPLGEVGIVCETIHRFKGLERDAVLLVLDGFESRRERMLTYVGLSRAKSLLAVVAPAQVLEELRAL